MITGAFLVLGTWVFSAWVLIALGAAPALVSASSDAQASLIRRSVWWGLALVTLLTLASNLWLPLRSGTVAFVILAAAVMCGSVARLLRHRYPATRSRARPWSAMDLVLIVALLLGVGYLALAAVGPVTNYDTGLYHLGAIRYAGEYATIPGLANLFFPLGYSTGQFPLAALLGNGPWNGEGFRLLNGLLIALLALDIGLRFVRRRPTVGAYVLLAGGLAAWVPMIALSDYWVTSPSSDSAVLVLTVIASGYLADAMWGGRNWQADALVTLLVSVLLLILRPTMSFFLAGVVLVLVVHAVRQRRRKQSFARLGWLIAFVSSAALLIVQVARDYVLSGWLQYPLSAWAFDVPWRAPDPVNDRIATLGNARDPDNLWEAAHNWGWIPTWLDRLPAQWETYEFAGLVLVAVVGLVVAWRRGATLRWRALLVTMLPSALATSAWFLVTPPAFRFVWGPLFTLAAIPLGWSVFAIARTVERKPNAPDFVKGLSVAAFALVSVVLVGYCVVLRLDAGAVTSDQTWSLGPVRVPYRLAPVTQPPVVEQTIASGLTVLTPTKGENCWSVFPLCTPRLPPTVHLRSDSLQGGLLP